MKSRFSTEMIFLVLLPVLVIVGCSKDKVAMSPFQPEIANTQNNFQFQATGIQNITTSVSYSWENTGTMANINQSCAITAGSAAISIMDASAVEVYTGNLSDNGTFSSTQGTAGSWTIRVDLYNVDGTLNFRVQTP